MSRPIRYRLLLHGDTPGMRTHGKWISAPDKQEAVRKAKEYFTTWLSLTMNAKKYTRWTLLGESGPHGVPKTVAKGTLHESTK